MSSKRRLSAYRLLIAPLIVSLFLLPGLASAAEYFVSPSGDDGNPGTSRSAPWRSIAKANAALRAGDVVFLLDGRYINDPIKPKSSGIAAQPIRYAAEPGAQPVLTSDKAGGLEVAIDLSGRSFVQVEGVHVDGVQPNPRAHVDHFVTIHGGSHITIRNCTFRFAHGWHGIRIDQGSHHIKLLNNVIDVVGIYDDGTGQDWGDSIQIGSDAHHNLIQGNTISRGSHNLLQVKGAHNVIRENTFENDWSDLLGAGKGGRTLELIGKHNLFELNIVRRARASTDKVSNAGMKAEGRSNIVRRNFIYDNSNEGITTQARSTQKWAHGNRIYHNTIYSNGGPAWGLVFFKGGTGVSDNVFKNNIVFANRKSSINTDADLSFQLESNPDGVIGGSIVEGNMMAKQAPGDVTVAIGGAGSKSLAEVEEDFSRNFRRNIQATPQFVSSNPEKPADFALAPGSRGIDEAEPLTHTAGGGSGKVIRVHDAAYFTDGFSLTAGDQIQIGGGAALRVVKVDYAANTLTVDAAATWQDGAPVSLRFRGSRPDIGAYESGLDPSKRPTPPGGLAPRTRTN